MTISAALGRNARKLLDEYGYNLTLRRVTGADSSGYVPGGTLGTTSNSDETVRGVFLSYRRGDQGQTLVEFGSRRAVLSGLQTDGTALTAPREADQLIGEGDAVSIKEVRTIKSGSTVIAYVCEVDE